MKKITRKEFIKLSTAAGAVFFLGACGFGEDDEKEKAITNPAQKSIPTDPAEVKLDLIDKNDERYELLRKGFNKRIDKFPLVIALCSTTDEVAAAIRYANKNKLAIAIKSGGHSMEGFSCNDGGMVINLSKMNKVETFEEKD